jgi:hypothetical protein
MTSRRSSLHELSAYRERQRRYLPPSDWRAVFIGFVLVGLPVALLIAGFCGWAL